MIVFGISNCDSVKKATNWLKKNKIDFTFFDFKKDTLTEKQISKWIKAKGVDVVVNKKSTTWKNLPEDIREKIEDGSETVQHLIEYPTLIKRPVIESGKNIFIGYDETTYQTLLSK